MISFFFCKILILNDLRSLTKHKLNYLMAIN
jgi:hypothetical protein